MSKPDSSSAALPIAYAALRILIVLNWVYGAGILAIFALTLVMPEWLMSAFDLSTSPDVGRVIGGIRTICVFGLATIPLNYFFLKKLLAIVDTVRVGDPFVPANAQRLQSIAWVLVALQLLGFVIDTVGKSLSTPGHPVELDAGFSINGWLAVLIAFVLARVFAEGARLREDLEGTV